MTNDDLIPDDFDLDAAKRAPSTTSDTDRVTCPECDSVSVCPNVRVKPECGFSDRETDYYCTRCNAHFDAD